MGLMNDMIQIPQFDADTRHISQALELTCIRRNPGHSLSARTPCRIT